MISFSESNEDINVISFFNSKTDLFFLDICGYKSNWFSNTFLLEDKYNWKGICCQPFPVVFLKLKKHRKVECYNYAISNKSDISLKFSRKQLSSARNIKPKVTPYIEINNDKKNDNEGTIVKTITLQNFLNKHKAPTLIHYLSINTTGSEIDIFKTFDFSKYTFLYITVDNNNEETKKTELKRLLSQNGYLYKEKKNCNHNYIHENTFTGTYYHKENYTKPIVIKRLNELEFSVTSSYWEDDVGTFNNGFIEWKKHGKGEIFFSHIDYGNGNIWHRDARK